MYIFNTTFLVADRVHKAWRKWLLDEYLPFVEESRLLFDAQVARVLSDEEQQEGNSFSVQFRVADTTALQEWRRKYEPKAAMMSRMRFGEEVLFFSTVLEII